MGKVSNSVIRELKTALWEKIEAVEEIQHSGESRYTKEQAKLNAYDDIVCILREMKRWED